MRNRKREIKRRLGLEKLETRDLMAVAPMHNTIYPQDVDGDSQLSPLDALIVINDLNRGVDPIRSNINSDGETSYYLDVDADGAVTVLDALSVINAFHDSDEPVLDPQPSVSSSLDPRDIAKLAEAEPASLPISELEVKTLLERASRATTSNDAIIAIVDRAGQILGVRTEQDVVNTFAGRESELVFAIDGAVAKARTAAFFSNGEAPLTSRTVRFISQSTITQREVESNPNIQDLNSIRRGPGFVAPIGLGGHFPPQVASTPLVDLFAIEHQSRDGKSNPGADGIKGTADDIALSSRFNVNLSEVPAAAKDYMKLFPESYGTQSGRLPFAQSRGIATMPGGIPLYKFIGGKPVLVGGIGVFFPGKDGYATFEQGFVHASTRGKAGPQSELSRLNAPKALEAEFIAFFAAGGTVAGTNPMKVTEFEGQAPSRGAFGGINGRIDLVGITLEIYGPTPTRQNTATGQQQVFQVGRKNGGGRGTNSGVDQKVSPGGALALPGQNVPEGWLVNPHNSSVDAIFASDVNSIIQQGINEANKTRAAIRLDLNTFKAGAKTKMVFAVTDSTGEVLGLYRMPDATVFSIDVAVAKARNTSYYASDRLVAADQVDANNDAKADVPRNTAFTNRTFRFLAGPRYPTGALTGPADFSILTMPGINPATAENVAPANPL
ncbi:MAG: dockerin type I domain-containing protein, partial [Pirellula staleyi]